MTSVLATRSPLLHTVSDEAPTLGPLDRPLAYRPVDARRLAAALPAEARALAPSFVALGRKYDLDPLALAAVARLESADFSSQAFTERNDVMGVGDTRRFRSPAQSIERWAAAVTSGGAPTMAELAPVEANDWNPDASVAAARARDGLVREYQRLVRAVAPGSTGPGERQPRAQGSGGRGWGGDSSFSPGG